MLSYAYYKKKRNKFIVADDLHPQTLDILETRSKTLGLKMDVIDLNNNDNRLNIIDDLRNTYDPNELCNVIFQYPNTYLI